MVNPAIDFFFSLEESQETTLDNPREGCFFFFFFLTGPFCVVPDFRFFLLLFTCQMLQTELTHSVYLDLKKNSVMVFTVS